MYLIFLLVWLVFDAVLGDNNSSAKILAIIVIVFEILYLIVEILN